MSEKSDHDSAQNNVGEEDKTGPGHPRQNSRWKKGGPSPNPRGRPRKEETMHLDAKKAFEQAINKKFRVSQADKKVFMTRIEAGLEQLLNQFAKGDRYARKDLMAYADKLGIDFLAAHRQSLQKALAPNLQAILDAYVARRSNSGNVEPSTPVLASPELLNDDCAEPAANPTAGSEAKTDPTAVATASANNNTGPPPRPPLPIKNEAAPAAPSVGTAPIDPAPPPFGVAATAAAAASTSAATAGMTGLTPQPKAQPVRRPAPAAPATQPRSISPPPPDPEPEPGTNYPKPFSRMTRTEKRAWYPDWWAKYVTWEAEQGID
jgi:hypothetical protein